MRRCAPLLAALVLLVAALPLCIGAAGPAAESQQCQQTFKPTTCRATAAVIEGPTEIKAGSTAFLKLSEAADWVSWKMLPQDAEASFMSFQSYLGMSPDGKPIIQHLGIFSTMQPGTYYFSVAASNRIHVVHTIKVTGNKPEPDPEPNPDPDPDPGPTPPPGKRFVLVIQEAGEKPSAARAQTLTGLRRYLIAQKHQWRIEDDDLTNSEDQPSEWMAFYLAKAKAAQVALPVLFVGVPGDDGVSNLKVFPLPDTAEKAIETVKGYGG
jgi:hypothetical protein